MSDYIHKSHNKSLLIYHFVCPIKCRQSVLTASISKTFNEVCQKIKERYMIFFMDMGLDDNYIP